MNSNQQKDISAIEQHDQQNKLTDSTPLTEVYAETMKQDRRDEKSEEKQTEHVKITEQNQKIQVQDAGAKDTLTINEKNHIEISTEVIDKSNNKINEQSKQQQKKSIQNNLNTEAEDIFSEQVPPVFEVYNSHHRKILSLKRQTEEVRNIKKSMDQQKNRKIRMKEEQKERQEAEKRVKQKQIKRMNILQSIKKHEEHIQKRQLIREQCLMGEKQPSTQSLSKLSASKHNNKEIELGQQIKRGKKIVCDLGMNTEKPKPKPRIITNSSQKICKHSHNSSENKSFIRSRGSIRHRLPDIILPKNKQLALKIAIRKDKSINPLKYNYLESKGISEKSIFEQYKDFEFKGNPKQLGNDYMKNINQKNSSLKNQSKSHRNSFSLENPQSYLEEQLFIKQADHNTYSRNRYRTDRSKSKKRLQKIQFSMMQKERNIIRHIKQLNGQKSYEDVLGLQKQVDTEYIDILAAKIQAARHMSQNTPKSTRKQYLHLSKKPL